MRLPFRSFAIAITLTVAEAAHVATFASPDRDLSAVAASRGAATRDGPRLTLHFASGGSFTYEDTAACHNEDDLDDATCAGYDLLGHEPAWHLFRVRVYFYEGDSHVLVDDRTGEETVIDGEPQFSQSGNHILETLYGPEGYDASGPAVQVWRRRGGKFFVEWKGEPSIELGSDVQYHLLTWPSPGWIEFKSLKRGEWDRTANRVLPDTIKYFTLKRRPKGWQLLHQPAPAQ